MNKKCSLYFLKHISIIIIISFITLFFPLYYANKSPVVWVKTNLYITNVQFKPPSLCELDLHYAVCDELQIDFQYNTKTDNYNCSINVSDNVSKVFNFSALRGGGLGAAAGAGLT